MATLTKRTFKYGVIEVTIPCTDSSHALQIFKESFPEFHSKWMKKINAQQAHWDIINQHSKSATA